MVLHMILEHASANYKHNYMDKNIYIFYLISELDARRRAHLGHNSMSATVSEVAAHMVNAVGMPPARGSVRRPCLQHGPMALVPVYQRSCSVAMPKHFPRGRFFLYVNAKIGTPKQVYNVNAQETSLWIQMSAFQVLSLIHI